MFACMNIYIHAYTRTHTVCALAHTGTLTHNRTHQERTCIYVVWLWQKLKDKDDKEIDTIRIDSWNTDTIVEFFKERLA